MCYISLYIIESVVIWWISPPADFGKFPATGRRRRATSWCNYINFRGKRGTRVLKRKWCTSRSTGASLYTASAAAAAAAKGFWKLSLYKAIKRNEFKKDFSPRKYNRERADGAYWIVCYCWRAKEINQNKAAGKKEKESYSLYTYGRTDRMDGAVRVMLKRRELLTGAHQAASALLGLDYKRSHSRSGIFAVVYGPHRTLEIRFQRYYISI